MNTVTIDSKIYKGVENYAKLHNISIESVIEKGMTLFLGTLIPTAKKKEKNLDEALALMDSMMIKGGKTIPADEDAMETFVETKYKL